MANNQQMSVVDVTLDMHESFEYPATAQGLVVNGGLGDVHIIWYVGNPVGLFAGVPNGSITIDGTNHHTYTKTGAAGSGKAGAWVINS
jgi:hypothetical protein